METKPSQTGISRRALLLGGAVAVVAVAVPVTATLWSQAEAAREAAARPADLVTDLLAKHPFTVAHRGGSSDWPEMSALSYANAVAVGVDALEMSVSRTSDGVWFGLHDGTLDRTSGTQGFAAAKHTWEEVQQHLISVPAGRKGDAQPYYRLEDLVRTYGTTHAIWVDPKAVQHDHYEELWTLMSSLVARPEEVYVAKSSGDNTDWANLAAAHGLQSWGFYYSAQLSTDPASFELTQGPWTLLGLDWNASAAQWASFVADGRPVVAHVLTAPAQRDRALSQGARGLMISGVTEILG